MPRAGLTVGFLVARLNHDDPPGSGGFNNAIQSKAQIQIA